MKRRLLVGLVLGLASCNGDPNNGLLDGSLDRRSDSDSGSDSGYNRNDGSSGDGSLEGRLDASDGNTNNDGSNSDGDGGATAYPIARLTCTEYGVDGKCIHRPMKDVTYCWDASGSEAGPSPRTLVSYRIYTNLDGSPGSNINSSDSEICGFYTSAGTFRSKLRVTDDLGNFNDDQDFWNIVSD